jgi:pilus assembly protein FimV
MLQQQLRQKDEDIAAKAAEIGELKERVAELEKLRQDQQAMIALKDSELAAAQQRLAQANAKPDTVASVPQQAAGAAQPTAEVRQPVPEEESASSTTPWLWGGLAFLGMAVLAWLVVRRGARPASKAPVRQRVFDADALAASLRAPGLASAEPEPTATPDVEAAEGAQEPDVAAHETPPGATAPVAARNETPTWHSGWVQTEPPSPPQPVAQAPRFVAPAPVAPPESAGSERVAQAPVIAHAKASVEHRMKLARAFLDIGDDHSAKQLLREIMDDVDPAARDEAARMLRELG